MKNCIILLTLCFAVYVQACYYDIRYRPKGGALRRIVNPSCKRVCFCLKNVNTHIIDPASQKLVRVFRSSDCTGAYQTIGGSDEYKNMEWVNSVSFGPSGASIGPNSCPSTFPVA